MRWIYFIILVLAALIVQITVIQVAWLPTPLGYVSPQLLASVAVFVALHARSRVDAALAGWILGFAVDLTGSGGGMGLLALLYMLGTVGVYQVREVLFRDRALTQFILSLLFCLFVYQLWTLYDVLSGVLPGGGGTRQAARAACLAVYTALVTPLVCKGLKRLQRLLIPVPARRERR